MGLVDSWTKGGKKSDNVLERIRRFINTTEHGNDIFLTKCAEVLFYFSLSIFNIEHIIEDTNYSEFPVLTSSVLEIISMKVYLVIDIIFK